MVFKLHKVCTAWYPFKTILPTNCVYYTSQGRKFDKLILGKQISEATRVQMASFVHWLLKQVGQQFYLYNQECCTAKNLYEGAVKNLFTCTYLPWAACRIFTTSTLSK